MRKSLILILLAVVLLALVGGFILLKNRPKTDQTKDQNKERVPISEFDRSLIKTMTFTTADHVLKLYKEGDVWKVEYDIPIKIDQDAVDRLTYSFSSLYSERIVEEQPQNLEQYGLDTPRATAAAALTDGTTAELYLGDQTPDRNSFYLMKKGDLRVFAVWFNNGKNFQSGVEDIRDRSLPTVNLQELTYLKLKRQGEPDIEVIKRDESQKWGDEITFSLSSLIMTSPYPDPKPISSQSWGELLEKFPSLKIEKFINDRSTGYAPYGLEKPSAEIVIRDGQNTLHLILGNTIGDLVAFKLPGEPAVYALTKDILKFLDVKPFTLVDKFAFIVNIDYVDRITLQGLGQDHELAIKRETLQKTGEDKKEEVKETFYFDGKEAEDKPFRQVYQDLLWVFVDAENEKPLNGTPEFQITYYLNRGERRKFTLAFVPYDVDFYALFKNGKSEYLVSRDQIKKMIPKLDAVFKP
ncbi:MAG TPA: DUF4340 domain-containing protein [Spirochaetia bacterium]|nr:DUF4340 domain-containing protein [Spirochaetia bacterium]